MASTQQELSKIYHRRFIRTAAYRDKVWQVLTREFFNQWVISGQRAMPTFAEARLKFWLALLAMKGSLGAIDGLNGEFRLVFLLRPFLPRR